ncbi:MAG: acyl-homoserine-lactone synthase [bacterium]
MYKNFSVKIGEETIDFGIAVGKEEIEDFVRLRTYIYNKNDYYSEKKKIDVDEYDNKKTIYIVAHSRKKVVAGLRLIFDKYLPTEKDCFSFKEPVEMTTIPRNKRFEIGRLVVTNSAGRVPRNILMLGLFKVVMKYSIENGLMGGYAFIKQKLYKKLVFINAPFHVIKNSKLIYEKETLRNYFGDPLNPVIPIYFLVSEFKKYEKKIFSKYLFKSVDDVYILRSVTSWNILRRFL